MCLFIWGTASEKAPKYRKVFSGVIADLLIADSEYAKNSFGLFKEKMVVEPLGTDIPILCKRRIRKNATTILTVARYDPRKNLETLLKAMKIVVTSHPEVQLIIVGGQTFKGKPNIYRQHIFKLIKHLDLEDKVKIIEDVSRTELFQIYKFSDIFVSSSTHEMFGLVLVEAMVSGLPIIATNATAIPEVVKQAGILIPPKRPNLLATTIIKLLQDFKLRKELSVIAMKRAKKFTAGQMYKRYFKWFAWLTKHR
jgi:glycosyltransferase involved in cell wall biosynthesis